MTDLRLPKPTERLAGCVWLPRFAAKVRLHHAGELEGDYLLAFCHPRAMDGRFLDHFGLDKDATLAAIRGARTDEELAQWFTSAAGVTPDRIEAWNKFAPRIGSPGQPGERELTYMLRRIYPDGAPPDALKSSFDAILWDERQSSES